MTLSNFTHNTDHIRTTMSLLDWWLLTRHITPCPKCGTWLTSGYMCPECGVRFEVVELKANSVTVINGGKRVISRNVLDNLANDAEAESWDCIDLPDQWQERKSSQLTQLAADVCPRCGGSGVEPGQLDLSETCVACGGRGHAAKA